MRVFAVLTGLENRNTEGAESLAGSVSKPIVQAGMLCGAVNRVRFAGKTMAYRHETQPDSYLFLTTNHSCMGLPRAPGQINRDTDGRKVCTGLEHRIL